MLLNEKRSVISLLCGSLLLFFSSVGYSANPKVISDLNLEKLHPIVKSADIKSQRQKTRSGNEYLLVSSNEISSNKWNSAIMLLDCKSKQCSIIRFYSSKKVANITPELINSWNANYRYARAYSNSDELIVEADLLLHGGVAQESIIQFLNRQQYLIESIEQHGGEQ